MKKIFFERRRYCERNHAAFLNTWNYFDVAGVLTPPPGACITRNALSFSLRSIKNHSDFPSNSAPWRCTVWVVLDERFSFIRYLCGILLVGTWLILSAICRFFFIFSCFLISSCFDRLSSFFSSELGSQLLSSLMIQRKICNFFKLKHNNLLRREFFILIQGFVPTQQSDICPNPMYSPFCSFSTEAPILEKNGYLSERLVVNITNNCRPIIIINRY